MVVVVDVGIFNLIGYEILKLENWYFGQCWLGMEVCDFYGQLIDWIVGMCGWVCFGGDFMGFGLEVLFLDQELVVFFFGVVWVGDDGSVMIFFDVLDFNGVFWVIVVVWSEIGVGYVEQDVEVCVFIVMLVSVFVFLVLFDELWFFFEIDNVDVLLGFYDFEIFVSEGLFVDG